MLLSDAARAAGMTVTGDGRLSETDAAKLVGLLPETLARKRAMGTGPAAFRLSLGGARYSYRLSDLARWIEDRREDAACD